PVGLLDGSVECVMCGCEFWVEPVIVGVVHLCDGGVLVEFTCIKDNLSMFCDFTLLAMADFWPNEVVKDNLNGIAVIAFHSASHGPHPCVVDSGVQYSELIECGAGYLHRLLGI